MPRLGKGRKLNAKGRSETSRFVRLDYRLLQSGAYRSLTPNARALLIELSMLYNGENNGSLYLGVQDAAHRMGLSDHHAASRAFDELQGLGLIEMTQDASFKVKASHKSRARTWRLAWCFGPGRKSAQWDFLGPPPKTVAYERMERGTRVLKTYRKALSQNKFPEVETTMEASIPSYIPAYAEVDSATLISKNSGKPQNHIMVDRRQHIATTMGSDEQRCQISNWWGHHAAVAAVVWVRTVKAAATVDRLCI